MFQLRLPPQTARSNTRSLAQIRQGRAYQAITHIITPANRRKDEPGRKVGRHVLHAVHRKIDRFLQQCLLQLLDKNPLAPDLRQRRLLHLVPAGLDDDNLRFHAGRGKQLFANGLRLPFGEHAAASANPQDSHRFSRLERNRSRKASTF